MDEVRVNMSKRLLIDHTIPLVDVAFMSGFEDQSYYSKVFKKITVELKKCFKKKKQQVKQVKNGKYNNQAECFFPVFAYKINYGPENEDQGNNQDAEYNYLSEVCFRLI